MAWNMKDILALQLVIIIITADTEPILIIQEIFAASFNFDINRPFVAEAQPYTEISEYILVL